jgi:NAD(P)-dependent dehydrogenase (short-subunit alcohol dehydrogenase family)
MRDLIGRCAVVTGAGSGIGAALARRLAHEGMNIVLADITPPDAHAVAAEIGSDRAIAVHCDVSDAQSVQALADAAEARFGPVALLCNNAGIVPGGRHRRVWEYSLNDWEWSLGVNLYGVVNGIRSFVPRMIERAEPAHVLNTASVAGFVSGGESACYGASKHAVVRVTEALYAGLRSIDAPIGVTMLSPGLVATRIYDAERVRPAHLADAAGRPAESAELERVRDEMYRTATTAEEAADIAVQGVLDDQLYVFTTAAFDQAIAQRSRDILDRRNPSFESIVAMSRKDSDLRDPAAARG